MSFLTQLPYPSRCPSYHTPLYQSDGAVFYFVCGSGMWRRLSTCTLWLVMLLSLLIACQPSTGSAQMLDSIIPSDYFGYGFSDFRSKREFADHSSHCSLCISSYDPDSCQRCWNSKFPVVPVHAKRSDSSSSSDYDQEGGLQDAEKRASYGYEPLVRYQRGSGCGCCYMSRFSNQHCCRVCSLASKRTGKRSGDLLTSDLLLRPPSQPAKRAYLLNPDCFCCFRYGGYGGDACCSRCFAK